jgi:hypothetical protein
MPRASRRSVFTAGWLSTFASFTISPVAFEAGPLSQWLYASLTEAGFESSLMETHHVRSQRDSAAHAHLLGCQAILSRNRLWIGRQGDCILGVGLRIMSAAAPVCGCAGVMTA